MGTPRTYQDRKEYMREYQRTRVTQRRRAVFDGKSCVLCQSINHLELHHIDPATKIDHRIWSWGEEKLIAELAKCKILCNICHDKEHWDIVRATREHGTERMYKHGKCRCDLCKRAHANCRAEYRRRTGKR